MLMTPETWKPPMPTMNSACAQRPGDVEGAGKLVRLHAHQHHHAGACSFDHGRKSRGPNAGIGLIKGMNGDVDIVAEDTPLGAVRARPYRAASEFDGMAERSHWIT